MEVLGFVRVDPAPDSLLGPAIPLNEPDARDGVQGGALSRGVGDGTADGESDDSDGWDGTGFRRRQSAGGGGGIASGASVGGRGREPDHRGKASGGVDTAVDGAAAALPRPAVGSAPAARAAPSAESTARAFKALGIVCVGPVSPAAAPKPPAPDPEPLARPGPYELSLRYLDGPVAGAMPAATLAIQPAESNGEREARGGAERRPLGRGGAAGAAGADGGGWA